MDPCSLLLSYAEQYEHSQEIHGRNLNSSHLFVSIRITHDTRQHADMHSLHRITVHFSIVLIKYLSTFRVYLFTEFTRVFSTKRMCLQLIKRIKDQREFKINRRVYACFDKEFGRAGTEDCLVLSIVRTTSRYC